MSTMGEEKDVVAVIEDLIEGGQLQIMDPDWIYPGHDDFDELVTCQTIIYSPVMRAWVCKGISERCGVVATFYHKTAHRALWLCADYMGLVVWREEKLDSERGASNTSNSSC